MFKDIFSNEEAKSFLINELKTEKNEGAYIFYGDDLELNMEFALSFAKALTCKKISNDFCDECESCKRMNSLSHGNLEIYEDVNGIKIESIREIIYKASTTSYEGGNRIFILKNVEKLKKESSNALLKLIEEPGKNNFFILLSKNLVLLPTIKSRTTILKIKNRNFNELGATEEEFNFFLGNGKEILEYKKNNINLNESYDYLKIDSQIVKYLETSDLIYKINIYKCLRDFYKNYSFLGICEKLSFAEKISGSCLKEKEIALEICNYLCYLIKDYNKLERLIETKNQIKLNISMKNVLRIFILEI